MTDPLKDLIQHALRGVKNITADNGPEIFHNVRLTHLTDAELARAIDWWATLSDDEKTERRDHSAKLRGNFGIPVPNADEDWQGGEGWAAVCYEDEIS